jgi:hypothetical protein
MNLAKSAQVTLIRKDDWSRAVYLWSIFPVLPFNRVLKFAHLSKRLGIMIKIFSLMMSDVVIFV